jgi:hypothetical protein
MRTKVPRPKLCRNEGKTRRSTVLPCLCRRVPFSGEVSGLVVRMASPAGGSGSLRTPLRASPEPSMKPHPRYPPCASRRTISVQLAHAKRARLGAKPGSHQSTPSSLAAGAGGARAAGLLPFPATVTSITRTRRAWFPIPTQFLRLCSRDIIVEPNDATCIEKTSGGTGTCTFGLGACRLLLRQRAWPKSRRLGRDRPAEMQDGRGEPRHRPCLLHQPARRSGRAAACGRASLQARSAYRRGLDLGSQVQG